jgi:hypothetical protein
MRSDFITNQATRQSPFLPLFTLPLVYGPGITTCCYKVLLQEYAMFCYGIPYPGPTCRAKVSSTRASLAPCGSQAKHCVIPHSTEQDTLPIASLISKQDVPYRRCGGTSSSRGLLLRTDP